LKKVFAVSVLVLFLFNTLGYYFIFQIFKYKVRKEIEHVSYSGSASFTVLQILNPSLDPDFKRIERKEFRYRGSLYDIIKEERSGDMTIFYCIHDKKEENLLAAMNAVNKNKFLLSLWQHLIKIAIPPVEVLCANPIVFLVIFPEITVKLPSVIVSKLNPPPESV